MEDWMRGRSSPIPDDAEIQNRKLETVARNFGTNWLRTPGSNPIQTLWSRDDAFSTSELLILGDAIEKLEQIDAKWVGRRIENIKRRKPPIRVGDVFELTGLGMLCVDGQPVLPAKENQPGFDGRTRLPDGTSIFLSMKNHDISRHEEHFEIWADRVVSTFHKGLEGTQYNGLGLVAVAREYPRETNWQSLSTAIPRLIESLGPSRWSVPQSDGFWMTKLVDISTETKLANNPKSYQTLIVSPYHANERKNLLDQLERGAANFEKHAAAYSQPGSFRCLFLRISSSASVLSCRNWAQQYFLENAKSPIDIILIYQASVRNIQPENCPGLVHQFQFAMKPGVNPFLSIDGSPQPLQIRTFIGRFADSDARTLIGDVPISDSYLFQRGDTYALAEKRSGGDLFGEMRHPADGIRTHSVVQNADGSFILSGKFPTSHRLLLYS